MQSAHGSGHFSGIVARGIAHLAGLVDDLIPAQGQIGDGRFRVVVWKNASFLRLVEVQSYG